MHLVAHLESWLLWCRVAALVRALRDAVRIDTGDVTVVLNVGRNRASFATIATHTFAGASNIDAAIRLAFAAALSTAFGHEGPHGDYGDDCNYNGKDDLFAHEGIHELVLEGGLFVGAGLVDALHVHLQLRGWVVLSELLEPLIAGQWRLLGLARVFVLRLHVLQILADHVLRDLEVGWDLNASGKLKIIRQLNAIWKSDAFGQLCIDRSHGAHASESEAEHASWLERSCRALHLQ